MGSNPTPSAGYDDIGYTCLGDTINIDKKKKVITVFIRRNNLSVWGEFAMPRIYRIYPSNFINIMVSVMPMKAPSGQIFHLDYVFGDSIPKVKKWNLKNWFKYIKNEIRRLNK